MREPVESPASDAAFDEADAPRQVEHGAAPGPAARREPPPITGHHDIDRALAALRLDDDVLQHPAAYAAAVDAVTAALHPAAVPAGLRPRP